MQNVENIADDAHPEFVLYEVDFVLVEIMVVALGVLLGVLLLTILLVSAAQLILNLDGFDFLLV